MIATVSIDAGQVIAPVAPEIYGGFIEHLGRNVYGGVFDPADPTADEDGLRRDVLDAVRELNTPVTRYPGGCFTDTWRWEEGVGPANRRSARLDYAWKQLEPNAFGIDEFMKWAKKAGTEPVLTLNLSTRGIQEAADLFEYCNIPGGTRYSDLRRENGSETPYNIRYWCLGNEIYGQWEIGHRSAAQYGQLARETAKLMKSYDPSLKMILCGCTFDPEWNRIVLEEAYEYIDFISLHELFNSNGCDAGEFLRHSDRFAAEIERTIRICKGVKQLKNASRDVAVCVDEWIIWDRDRRDDPQSRWTAGRHLLEQDFSMLEAALAGELFSMFHNHADVVKLACVAQSVNAIAPIRTAPGGRLWKQTVFYPFSLTSRYGRGVALKLELSPEILDCLYMSAIWNPDGSELVVFLTSRRLDSPVFFRCPLAGFEPAGIVEAVTLSAADCRAVNTETHSPVVPHEFGEIRLSRDGVSGTLEPGSWNMVRISGRLLRD